jgi:TetR/AcrR family transcriptional repressor of mexJK operon
MTVKTADRSPREGSPAKRAAILAAARELFVRDGYDRTSMDAISARANVSKRTVYDYYGDKQRLLLGVVEAGGEVLMAALERTLAAYLADDAGITTVPQLEQALKRFAVDLGVTIMDSAAYTVVIALVRNNFDALEEQLTGHPMISLPEERLAERLEHFTRQGLLEIPDARLAADHFNALTTLLAYAGPDRTDPETARLSLENGVHAFIRAYGVRSQ